MQNRSNLTSREKTEEPKLTDDSKSGFKKVDESRKESKMTNLTSDTNVKETIKFGEVMKIDGKFDGELITESSLLARQAMLRQTLR